MWTLLHLKPQSQIRYIDHLKTYHPAIEVYVPHHLVLCRPHGVRRPIEKSIPCYPGYIFANPNLDSGEHYYLTHGPIRAYFVRFGAHIESIPSIIIERLKELESTHQLIPETPDPYAPGNHVHVVTQTMDIRAIIVRLMTYDKILVDTPFCQIVVPLESVKL
jgi:hypothetical protein